MRNLQTLLNKLAEKIMKATSPAPVVVVVKEEVVRHNKVIQKQYMAENIDDIKIQIIAKGYKAIPEILKDFQQDTVQQFVQQQLVLLGQFDPERDNLDSCTKKDLIKMALHNNKLQYRQRMTEQGKVPNANKAQLDYITNLCTKNNYAIDMNTIRNSWEASDMIEYLKEKFNIQPKGNTATVKQIEAINKLASKLNMEVASTMTADFNSASKTISELGALLPKEEYVPKQATVPQIEYALRVWKLLGHRITAKKKEEFNAMTTQTLSKEITAMNKELYTQHPELNAPTEGQIKYLRQLLDICMLPVPEQLPTTKEACTKSIDNLNRQYLFLQMKSTSPDVTREDIKKMTINQVKELLEQLKTERRSKYYTDNSEGTGGNEGEITF